MDQIHMGFSEDGDKKPVRENVKFVVEDGKVIVKEQTRKNATDSVRDYLITNKVKNIDLDLDEVKVESASSDATSTATTLSAEVEEPYYGEASDPSLETKLIPFEILNNL